MFLSAIARMCLCFVSDLTLSDILQPLTSVIHGEPVNVVIRRRAVLRSCLLATQHSSFSFHRPVHITFSGEDALDEGGPAREFFRLAVYTLKLALTNECCCVQNCHYRLRMLILWLLWKRDIMMCTSFLVLTGSADLSVSNIQYTCSSSLLSIHDKFLSP